MKEAECLGKAARSDVPSADKFMRERQRRVTAQFPRPNLSQQNCPSKWVFVTVPRHVVPELLVRSLSNDGDRAPISLMRRVQDSVV